MDSQRTVAIVGIAATAVVGVVGATSSWLTARGARANDRALAHEQRVYDRRADAYLAALQLVERQRRQILNVGLRTETVNNFVKAVTPLMGYGADAFMHARVVAFGSPDVVAALDDLSKKSEHFSATEIDAAYELTEMCGPNSRGKMVWCLRGTARSDVVGTYITKFYAAHADFEKAEKQFELLVQRELS